MNEWAKKTVRLAKTKDYLDRLYDIYPNDPVQRQVDLSIINSIEETFINRDCIGLLNRLLDLDKFPFKDSYISFLRSDRTAIKRNPKTVKRICDILFDMGFAKVREGIVEPKEAIYPCIIKATCDIMAPSKQRRCHESNQNSWNCQKDSKTGYT